VCVCARVSEMRVDVGVHGMARTLHALGSAGQPRGCMQGRRGQLPTTPRCWRDHQQTAHANAGASKAVARDANALLTS
jgi:hypothetical protein